MKTPGLTFGGALKRLKLGQRLARAGWNGKGMYIKLSENHAYYGLQAYIYMKPVRGAFVPWVASQTDLLAEDWFVV